MLKRHNQIYKPLLFEEPLLIKKRKSFNKTFCFKFFKLAFGLFIELSKLVTVIFFFYLFVQFFVGG